MGYNRQDTQISGNKGLRIMITGKVGEGKTKSLRNFLADLDKQHIPYTAILAEGSFSGQIRKEFHIHLLPENKHLPLCSRKPVKDWFSWRDWWFNPEAFEAGSTHLQGSLGNGHILILDEVGQLELEGKGWARLLDNLLAGQEAVIISCRDTFSAQVASRWPASWQKHQPDTLMDLIRQGKP